VFVIFSLMRSKLISYLIPMYPAAAILIADWMVRTTEDPSRRKTLSWGLSIVDVSITAVTIGCAFYLERDHFPQEPQAYDYTAAWIWVVQSLVLVICGITGAVVLALSGRRQQALMAMTCGVASFFLVAVPQGTLSIERFMNAPLHTLARGVGREIHDSKD